MIKEGFFDPDPSGEAEMLGVLGDYVLRREVGRGRMAVVYEAWERSMGRTVALKALRSGTAADAGISARFMREAQAAGKLRHRNIVPVFFMGVKDETPFYAMEYVEGETLAQILRSVKKAESGAATVFGKKDRFEYFTNVADAFADVADGLHYAHSSRVVHRDIKPSNLILDRGRDRGESRYGHLRVLDLGLARLEVEESLALFGDFVGTLRYMSPEQARPRSGSRDRRTDIYSLGATLYEMLTFEPPFQGRDDRDTLRRIIRKEPRPPHALNSAVPRDMESIVLKCLRKEPRDRYRTAEALAQDLRRFLRRDPIEARPQSVWEKLGRHLCRYRRIVIWTPTHHAAASLTIRRLCCENIGGYLFHSVGELR